MQLNWGVILKNNQSDYQYDDAMTALERKFQKHIKRVLIIIVGFIIFVLGFQYKSMHNQAVGVIENQVTSISFELNAIFERIETQSNLMQEICNQKIRNVR